MDPKRVLVIAGALLILNALLFLANFAASPVAPGSPAPSSLSIIADVALAVAFFQGKAGWKDVAVVRVALGLLFFAGAAFARNDWITACATTIGYGGLLLLMVGRPNNLRAYAGTALFTTVVLLDFLALLAS